MVIFNDKSPTFNSFADTSYWEILDLVIGSSSLIGLISDFVVLDENLTSDHNIVSIKIEYNGLNNFSNINTKNTPPIPRYNFAKADWQLYYKLLNDYANSEASSINELDIISLNKLVTHRILEAAEVAIPKFKKTFHKSLPYEILVSINERKRYKSSKRDFSVRIKQMAKLHQQAGSISG